MLTRWATGFSKDQIQPRIYDRLNLLEGAVAADFIRFLGLPSSVRNNASSEVRANEAIDPVILEVLRRVNDLTDVSPGARRKLQRAAKSFRAAKSASGHPGAVEFLRSFDESNERLRAEWFPDLATVFPQTTDPDAPPDALASPLTENHLLFVARLAEAAAD